MKVRRESKIIGVVMLMGVIGLGGVASAATSSSTHARASQSVQAHVVKTKKLAFRGSYSGNIAMLWNSSTVTATSVTGKGTATLLGASKVTGKGSGSDTATCNPFGGTGSLTGGGSVLRFKVVSSSSQQACAAGQSAPTSVALKGVATVIGGTGKYAGATGKLAFTGSFSIQSTVAGSSESDAFTATLHGSLTVKG